MSIVDQYDAFLFDLDGTILLGDRLLPGAAEVLRTIQSQGKTFLILTNNPYRSAGEIAEQLSGLGVRVEEDQLLTAGAVAASLVRERHGAGALTFVMGAPSLHEVCRQAGLTTTEAGRDPRIRAAVVGGFFEFDYRYLREANWAVRTASTFIATNKDPVFPTPEGLWPGTGSIVAAVETATGRTAEVAGKPEPAMFRVAREKLPSSSRLLMIGDRLETDVRGGRQAGVDTGWLTDSGQERGTDVQPTYRLSTLLDLLR